MSEKEIDTLVSDAPFIDRGAFKSKLLKESWDIVFMSMLPDCHEGVYRHKVSGRRICFSSFNYDITNPNNWEKLISGEYTNHNFKFTEEILRTFANKFVYEGHLSVECILSNVRFIRQQLPKRTTLVLMLGSEIECDNQTTLEFANQAEVHKEVNARLRNELANAEGIKFINYTDFITSQKCFNGCTNHFSRPVYCEIAKKVVNVIIETKKQNKHSACIVIDILKFKITFWMQRYVIVPIYRILIWFRNKMKK